MEDTEYVDVGAEVDTGPARTADAKHADPWKFLMGTALSVYQNAGGVDTNWSTFEQRKNWLGQPVIEVRRSRAMSCAIGCSSSFSRWRSAAACPDHTFSVKGLLFLHPNDAFAFLVYFKVSSGCLQTTCGTADAGRGSVWGRKRLLGQLRRGHPALRSIE